jgi:hypothetical protein
MSKVSNKNLFLSLVFLCSYFNNYSFVLFWGVIHFLVLFCYFPRVAAGAGTLTPLAPITLQEMKLDPTMAAYQQGKQRVNEM